MLVIFRADGNRILGAGHIMRCMSIADACKSLGMEVLFVSADDECREMITGRNFVFISLESDYKNMESELPELLKVIDKYEPACVFVDSYFVTPEYLSFLKQRVRLLYLDDLNMFPYDVDVCINYNIYGTAMDYSKHKSSLYLGPKYAPLRNAFSEAVPIAIKEKISRVLVLTGGADSLHVALNFAQTVNAKEGLEFVIVSGSFSDDLGKLREIERTCNNIKILHSVKDMKSLMESCDMAVSAAGSTQYELCALGVPTINYVLADNQIPGALGFEREKVMIYAGDVRSNNDFYGNLITLIDNLSLDFNKRKKMSEAANSVLDGKGAVRIANVIAESGN